MQIAGNRISLSIEYRCGIKNKMKDEFGAVAYTH